MKVLTLKKVAFVSFLLSLLLGLAILLSITIGSVRLSPIRSIRILLQSLMGMKGVDNETEKAIILSVRFPRTLLAAWSGPGSPFQAPSFRPSSEIPLPIPIFSESPAALPSAPSSP